LQRGRAMQKRKLSAKEILADIKAGMSDSDLKAKYELLDNQLEKVFEKLSAAGLLKQSEIESRGKSEASAQTVFNCPACGKQQTSEVEECPDCGAIRSGSRGRPNRPKNDTASTKGKRKFKESLFSHHIKIRNYKLPVASLACLLFFMAHRVSAYLTYLRFNPPVRIWWCEGRRSGA
jgi:hypothetical protein